MLPRQGETEKTYISGMSEVDIDLDSHCTTIRIAVDRLCRSKQVKCYLQASFELRLYVNRYVGQGTDKGREL
jgi:hypothetical protein